MSPAAKRLRSPTPKADAARLADQLRSVLSEADAADYLRRVMADLSNLPRWVPGAQELWFTGRLVKRYCHVATNQAPVLAAFQAAGWPRRIDDPLPHVAGRNRKRRRRDTVESRNEGLTPGTIRFFSDETGKGIRWEEVS